MVKNIIYHIIERQFVVLNPFQFFYDLKYKPKENIIIQFNQAKPTDKKLDFVEWVLRAIFDRKSQEYLVRTGEKNHLLELEKVLSALFKSNCITGSFTIKRNDAKEIINIYLNQLEINEKGVKLLNLYGESEDYEHLSQLISLYKDFSINNDIMLLDKKSLLKSFMTIQNNLLKNPYIMFYLKSRQGLEFDRYTGRILIHQYNAIKQYMEKQSPYILERNIAMFLKDTINTMTEVKIILQGIKDHNFKEVAYYIGEDQVHQHLLYLVSEGLIHLELSREPNLTIHRASITEKGKKYFYDGTLIKLKHERITTKIMINALDLFVKKHANDQTKLQDFSPSEFLS